MKDIIDIIDMLKSLSGNAQLAYLNSQKDNNILKEILWYTYNPNLKFGIAEKAFNKSFEEFELDISNDDLKLFNGNLNIESWNRFKSYLDKFSSQKGVKEQEIYDMISEMYLSYNHSQLDLFKGILFKDLRINMGVSSFNKVWKDFYVMPEVMLAKKWENKPPENAFLSRKLDGSRMYYLDGKFYSRTNKEINFEPTKHILEQLKDFNSDYVLDGEILYLDKDGKEDFQKGISLISNEKRLEGCDNLHYACFDMIDKDEFLNKKCTKPFKETYYYMCRDLKIDRNSTLIVDSFIAPTKRSNVKIVIQCDYEKLPQLQELANKKGWEGLMVRDMDKPYECKRTSALQKIKKMEDAEFKIVGFKEGQGKYEGTLGTITIELETGETVDVGSGYSDVDREYIWNNQQNILDSCNLLKVQFFERTKNKEGQNSLRFPVFLCFRTKDGMEVSI